MKYKILATFILFLANLGFAQSKKEQIQLLTARLDSLKSIQSIDKQTYNEIINELELSINSKNKKVSEFSISLAVDKTKHTSNIELNEQFDKEILSLIKIFAKYTVPKFIKLLKEQINEQEYYLLNKEIKRALIISEISKTNKESKSII